MKSLWRTVVCIVLLTVDASLSQFNQLQHDIDDNTIEAVGVSLEKYVVVKSPVLTDKSGQRVCHYKNKTVCDSGDEGTKCRGFQVCPNSESKSHDVLCYILWSASKDDKGNQVANTTEDDVVFKGCWLGKAKDCVHHEKCIERRFANQTNKHLLLFCCCSGDHCNDEAIHDPKDIPREASAQSSLTFEDFDFKANPKSGVLPVMLSILGGCILILSIIASILRTKKCWLPKTYSGTNANEDNASEMIQSPRHYYDLTDPTSLSPPDISPRYTWTKVAQGRCGFVYRAPLVDNSSQNTPCLQDEGITETYVAVKDCDSINRSTWKQECLVYLLPQMKHDNILAFKGSREDVDPSGNLSYWVVTEYHERGSLYDFIKVNTVTFPQMLNVAQGIASGLAFLHDEKLPSGDQGYKPAVAHRDFKSKNVLLKRDMTPCIADFGLALILDSRKENESLPQVGTARYMAPEVLDGAVSNKRDALLAIDMYACGLVLWEVASRCKVDDDWEVLPYKLPFEDTIPHASIPEMQSKVNSFSDLRPPIPTSWEDGRHEGMRSYMTTVKDLWEEEAPNRLTAACVEERIKILRSNVTSDGRHRKTILQESSLESFREGVILTSFTVGNNSANHVEYIPEFPDSSSRAQHSQLQTLTSHHLNTSIQQSPPPTQTLLYTELLPQSSLPSVVLPPSHSTVNNTNLLTNHSSYSSRYGTRFKDSSIGSTTPLLMTDMSEP